MLTWFIARPKLIFAAVGALTLVTVLSATYIKGRTDGAKNATIRCNANAIEAGNTASSNLERSFEKANRIKDDALDTALRNLGIMRDPANR